jgi:hypothetical protein
MAAKRRFSLPRDEAVIHGNGTRHCANCGDYIDPIDWCFECQKANAPCGRPHRRLRKRTDAAYCDSRCRAHSRYTYARDCL